jgi:PAS domain S-box-containing protein
MDLRRATLLDDLAGLPRPVHYALALGVSAAAVGVSRVLTGTLGGVFFTIPLAWVALSGVLLGAGPALLVTALTAAGNVVLLLGQPPSSAGHSDVVRVAAFVITGALLAVVAGSQRRTRLRLVAERAAADRAAEAARATSTALAESEERFRTLADNIAQLAWMADGSGATFWYNERWYAYTGAKPHQVLGWGWKSVHHPDHVDRVAASFTAALRAGTVWEDTFPLRGQGGGYRWFLSRAVPIRGADDRVVRWFGTNTDVTAQREAEEAARASEQRSREIADRLREEDRRKDDFLAMLSHELRNPLAPVQNALHLLDQAPAGGEQARRAREVIGRQVRHLTRLVDDLLDVTRISRGKIHLRRERVDLAGLVERTVEDHRPVFAHAGVALAFEDASGRLVVDGDPTRLAQIIGNLLQNAAKFTPPGGLTTVSLARAGARAEVRVRDSGQGIDPALLPRVFEPFTQADASLDRARGGLGLGLALVRGMVELHGGEVSAWSEGPGHGAELTIRLPLAPEEAVLRAVPSSPPALPGGRRILVIEDNADAAETLRDVLELAGHRVQVALDGIDGLRRARAFQPEVVLCDLGLPAMSGFEVAAALRAEASLRGARLVALSGYALPEDVQRSLSAGFDRHMAKPPDLEELQALVAELPVAPRGHAPEGAEAGAGGAG